MSLKVALGLKCSSQAQCPPLCLLPMGPEAELIVTFQYHICLHATMFPTMTVMD